MSCPVETTLGVIGGRWKVLVLHHLFRGTRRFNELHRALDGISHRTLTSALRELASDGILRREVSSGTPLKVEYSLTRLGRSLEPILSSMHAWGDAFDRQGEVPSPRKRAGTVARTRVYARAHPRPRKKLADG